MGKGDGFHLLATGGAPGGGELVEGEQEVPLMQALGAGRQGERFLPFACLCMVGSVGAGRVQYFCHRGKAGNGAEGQPGRAGTAHPPAAGTTWRHQPAPQGLGAESHTASPKACPSQCHHGLGRCDRHQEHQEILNGILQVSQAAAGCVV